VAGPYDDEFALLDDEVLVTRARDGDIAAYEELVRRHAPLAHRTALLMGAGEDVSDAVQEAFVKAWHALPRFVGGAPFRPWLLTVVANEARNRRRRAVRGTALARRLANEHATSSMDAPPADAQVLAAERRDALFAALDRLPQRQRDVVACRYLLELSEDETAQLLAIPKGTVKSRLSRAVHSLELALRSRLGDVEPVGDESRSDATVRVDSPDAVPKRHG
jgi:RNA polymerase sigma-70 factor (ECF subfamily)